ncbi:MAG: PAS domain-containing protein [Phycisphaerales bacterium]|nr:PAS domain-containing protein [Phycisphaerales bacterium]
MTDVKDSNEPLCRHLCQGLEMALVVVDREMRVLMMNPAVKKIMAVDHLKGIGSPVRELFPPERREQVGHLLEQTLRDGVSAEFDFWSHNPSDHAAYLIGVISPIKDDMGALVGASIVVSDTTQRVELLRQMADLRKMSALGSMAGAVAHHFNNLLGGVLTTIDFAQSSDDPQALKRALRISSAALTRANELTRDLLVFAEGDRMPSAQVRIIDIVKSFVECFSHGLDNPRIILEKELQPVEDMYPDRPLRTVLKILAANACEAMPLGGKIRLELTKEGREVCLRFADNGPGILREHISQVLEPFFTAKQQNANLSKEPTGMGLAVAHGIIRNLGGVITLNSRPGEGTVCMIRLPATEQ